MNHDKQRTIQGRARLALVSFSVVVLFAIIYITANVSAMHNVDEKIETFTSTED